ncbi:putative bacteriocin export ABC transporter [Thomasclavelia cocleata]|jgi:putative ABC transport system ATP-binding protein|uniref:ABC transporter ATP-binding protein YxdL n=1 Tax=Thomasclavelia cocleata TaxID=69824 RepID=A0A829ZBS8_9FIRM|nr:putative bacteriocin export ABC transporter [Thomasclavelia cocleata]MCI9629861.1 putative bacteriocin export ABC transporter [Thomasclavelia cocleata]GFI40838.1 ABC transporter ATP-binding protein YxdL [Thomasclavelia cocleata]
MIKINNLSKKYNDNQIFKNFNCEINENEMVAIKGMSGSGKTTLLNIIGLLDNDYKGNIIINGVDVSNLNRKKREQFIRENISYLFQNYALIDDESIKDNLMLALEYVKMNKTEKKDLIKKTLKKVGIEKDINEKIYSLSGGEQQRVSLARTLLKPSKLILADEPTGNLDESNRNDIIKILLEMQKKGKTIIIVTHDNVVAQNCNTVIEI